MVADIQFELKGVDQLSRTLKTLDNDVKKKSGRFALRKAGNIVATAVRQGAQRLDDPNTSESIARNVAVRFSPRRFKRTGDLMFRVGLLGGAKGIVRGLEFKGKGKDNPGGDTFYWRFLEFGTEQIAARPFMRPALRNNIQAATDEFTKAFQKAIDRAARRASKASGI